MSQNATTRRIPVIEGLFAETPAGPRLLGSRCTSCGTPYFPRSAACHHPRCDGGKTEDVAFGPRGKLWSFTVQHYAPPPPVKYDEPFAPYAMGAVDLPEGLRVMARISADDLRAIEVDMDVELVLEPVSHDKDGNELITWKFRRATR